MLEYRYSTEADLPGLRALVMECFGVRDDIGIYNNLDGRYLLCIDSESNKIIGMTSLESSDEYINGVELGISCVSSPYRKRGIMTKLIGDMLAEAIDRGYNRLYCSGWHMPYKENANLHSILVQYGFELVVENRVRWVWGYNCNNTSTPEKGRYCANCIRRGCSCSEDLYVKELRGV